MGISCIGSSSRYERHKCTCGRCESIAFSAELEERYKKAQAKIDGNSYIKFTQNIQGNPNPDNFEIKRSEQIGEWLLLEIVYPDCKNYEGKKILLYRSTLRELLQQKHIDPHFSDNPDFISPFARFEPTAGGWNAARNMANSCVVLKDLKK